MSETVEKPKNIVETVCKECVWAEYEGKTQVDCKLGRLAKFRTQGTLVAEVYDDDKEFFVIENRVCNACRNSNWAAKTLYDYTGPESTNELYLVTKLGEEIRIKQDVFVHITTDSTYGQIRDILLQLEPHKDFIENLIVLLNGETTSPSEIRPLLSGFNWSIKKVCELNATLERAVSIFLGKTNTLFYTVVFPGQTLPENLLEKVDYAINSGLKVFNYVVVEEDSYCCQTILHQMWSKNIKEEIDKIAIEKKCKPVITLEELDVDYLCV